MNEKEESKAAVPYQMLADKIDKVAEGQKMLEVSFARLEAGVTPKHEIVQEIEKRVPMTMYLADKSAMIERIAKMEAAPQSARSWANTYVAVGGCITSLALGILTLAVSLIAILHSFIH